MDMETELRGTCHHARVNDIVFPAGCPELFVTCSVADIRVWNAALRQELLRIQVPNLECNCVGITRSGGTIISGWGDGKIRAFYPESGKLKFVISDAHEEGVTAVALTQDDDTSPPWRIISGGGDGRVRIWSVTSSHRAMSISWKEHRGPVTCIQVSRENQQCISGSADGSCIVWDLNRGVRVLALFEPNVFKGVLYHPDESQYLTCGSNHKVTYWDAYDGSAIRVIDGGEEEMNTLDVERSGDRFVSGGDDGLVKVWHYDDGIVTAVGSGHSGRVSAVRISPDCRTIISVGSEGGIFIWKMPSPSIEGEVTNGQRVKDVVTKEGHLDSQVDEDYAVASTRQTVALSR